MENKRKQTPAYTKTVKKNSKTEDRHAQTHTHSN